MKAAVVRGPGQPPVYAEFAEPVASPGEARISVTAAALSPTARSRASGAHYSSSDEYPFVAGVDGVGRAEDGSRVYFVRPRPPFGSLAERTVAPRSACVPLPDALDDVTAAAIAIPGMSSWAALSDRARLERGETVLVNGATGAAGRLAVQIARHLGAGKIIATGRDEAALREVSALGAEVTISLRQDAAALDERLREQFAARVDVVLDYLWGPVAERLLVAAARFAREAARVRFVELGSMAGAEITLPSAVLRASAIELMGSGTGSVPPDRLISAIDGVLRAAVPQGFHIATRTVALAAIDREWARPEGHPRTVFTVDGHPDTVV